MREGAYTREARETSVNLNATELYNREKSRDGLPFTSRPRRVKNREEEISDTLGSAVVLLTSNNEDDITTAITGEPEQASNVASFASGLSGASVASIKSIASYGTDEPGFRGRITAFFSESLTLNPEEYPRAAALRELIRRSFSETGASLSSFLRSGASGGKSLLVASGDFMTLKYNKIIIPYLKSLSDNLTTLDPRQHYDAIYGVTKNIRAAILAIRHSYSLGEVIVPIIKSILVTLGTFLYNAGDAFITWLQSQQPAWVTNFLEMLYEAASAILHVSMDDALGMGESTEVVPVLVVIVTVLVVYDKFGPGRGLGERLNALITTAFTKLTRLGEAIIAKVSSLGTNGYDLAIRCWNSTRQIREIYTHAVGALHIPFYVVATITTMSARALYLGFINLYGLGRDMREGLKRAGDQLAVKSAADILEGLKALEALEGRAKGLEGKQDEGAKAECLEITREAEILVDLLLREAERLEAERLEAERLEAERLEAEGGGGGGGGGRRGGARKSKSSRRRRGPTVNKKQKKSRRYKRSNKGGSRKNKKATKKRRN